MHEIKNSHPFYIEKIAVSVLKKVTNLSLFMYIREHSLL
jgi:hypothetical protein